jgi:vancomycin resistance protein YoaR
MRRLIPLNYLKKTKLLTVIAVIFLLIISWAAFEISYYDKISPNISVAGVGIGGKSFEDAVNTLSHEVNAPKTLRVVYREESFNLELDEVDFSYDFDSTTQRAFVFTRSGNQIYDFYHKIKLLFTPIDFGLVPRFDDSELDKFISVIAGTNIKEPVYPSVQILAGQIVIDKGMAGTQTDRLLLRALIGKGLAFADENEITLPTQIVDPSLTEEEAEELRLTAEKFVGKNLILTFDSKTFTIKDVAIVKFLDPHGKYLEDTIVLEIDKIATGLDSAPQNPKFNFDGSKVTEFVPAKDGIETNREALRRLLIESLDKLGEGENSSLSLEIPVKRTPPEVSTDKVNGLGIKELIGKGDSTYFGSIPSRVHNVALGASRINGTLVAPGETFSFNETLGDVSKFTGYKEAYIISGGKTILGDGGGVCQVSTTLFRALLDAGLPITERAAHAYRVGYYEQGSPPGFDATVYGPSPDLKFTNDTDHHILIQAYADTKRSALTFEIYGTKDGRVSRVSKPQVTNITQPPPDIYQDDPTLPAGTTRQIEYRAVGSRVSFNYVVEKNGETLFQKTFVSNYRPWQAVYLKGTGQ